MAHVLQDAEPAVLQAGKIFALEDQQIPVAFDLAAQRLQSRRPVGHDVVELRVERGDGRVGEVGSQLVVVIDQMIETIGRVRMNSSRILNISVMSAKKMVASCTVVASSSDLT